MNNLDINYDEVFGVSSEGEKVQEPAAPETETSVIKSEGEKVQEPAAPETETQTAEENARFAAARRRAEQEASAKLEKAKADHAKEIDSVIESLGIVDPFSNSPIRTKVQYDAYMTRKRAETEASMITASGMTQEEFEAYKNNLPEVVAAREQLSKIKAREAEEKIASQLAIISELDPSVKTIEDIAKSPVYEEVYEKTRNGYSLSDAWKLANMDRLSQDATSKAKQAVINSYNGKSHMTTTSSRGEGMTPVPDDVAAMYRMYNPDVTDAEILRHYNKNL